jgi:hypothetical protein
MAGSSLPPLFLPILLILCYAALPTHAFGAGNIASISKIEGMNWRHGDIEDTLLQLMMARALGGKKFDSMTIKRIYFGNWLRDYSQAIDVGALKYVEAPTIRLLVRSVRNLLIIGRLIFSALDAFIHDVWVRNWRF